MKSEKKTDTGNFRSAFITFIGRPNSGKSTLLNTIIGQEISIVTDMPQTTRNIIRGIYTTDSMQLIFIDTPGIHNGKHKTNHIMLKEAKRTVEENVDIVCWIVDLCRDYGEEESMAAELIRSVKKAPVIVIFNKTDIALSPEGSIEKFRNIFPDLSSLPSVKLSAIDSSAKEIFLSAIDPYIPEGLKYFDEDQITDSTMRQIAAEYIRKQIIEATREEVPHAAFVEIESYREKDNRHEISAIIHVETEGQKGIIIGKGGKVINRIKHNAAVELMKFTEVPVNISCRVKVTPRWRDNETFLRRMGLWESKRKNITFAGNTRH